MRHAALVVVLAAAALIARPGVPRAAADMPDWAYAIPQPPPAPPATPPPPDTSTKTLPGSTLSFTRQQISDGFGPADWFPGDHPAMPDIVAHGKRPGRARVRAVPLPERQRASGERGRRRPAGVVLHPDDERFPERRAQERGVAQGEHEPDDHLSRRR